MVVRLKHKRGVFETVSRKQKSLFPTRVFVQEISKVVPFVANSPEFLAWGVKRDAGGSYMQLQETV